jgi:hypothetical protein
MRDFRLHNGYNTVVVKNIIQNCREVKIPFNPIVSARLEVTSPKHKVYAKQAPKQKVKLIAETTQASKCGWEHG